MPSSGPNDSVGLTSKQVQLSTTQGKGASQSPAESRTSSIVDPDDINFNLPDDIDRLIFAPSSRCLKFRDKLIFTGGVVNLALLVYFSGKYPWIMPYYYTVKFPVLMIIRLYSFCEQDWQYFLLDWCYFANLLVLLYLWTPLSSDPNAFTVVFCIAHGALPWAVYLFRNSLVFHSLDRITSCFIHISPMLVMWCLRWSGPHFQQDSRWAICDPATGVAVKTKWVSQNASLSDRPALPGCGSVFWTLGMPVAAYIVWFMIYGIVMSILSPDLKRYSTTYTLMTRKGLGLIIRNMPMGYLIYAFINSLIYAIMVSPAALFLWFEWVNFGFVVFIMLVASWNGGSFYVEVFSRKYQEQIASASRDGNFNP